MEVIFSQDELREEILSILGTKSMRTRKIVREIMRRNAFSFKHGLNDHEKHSLAEHVAFELRNLVESGLVVRTWHGQSFMYHRKL